MTENGMSLHKASNGIAGRMWPLALTTALLVLPVGAVTGLPPVAVPALACQNPTTEQGSQEPDDENSEAQDPMVRRKLKAANSIGKPGLSWRANGRLERQWVQSFDTMIEGLIGFYQCDETRLELELSDTQKQEYSSVVGSWERAIDQLKEDIELQQKDPNNERGRDWTAEWKAVQQKESDSARKIDDLLLDHQRTWLEQLQFRFLVRSTGLPMALGDQETMELLQLSPQEMEKVRFPQRESTEELERKIRELQEKAIGELLAQFDEAQRKAIVSKWPNLSGKDARYCEFFRIHLLMVEEFQSLKKMATDFERWLYFPSIELSPAGLYGLVERQLPEGGDRANSANTFFFHSQDREFLIRELSLDGVQIDLLWQAWEDLSAASAIIIDERTGTSPGPDPESFRDAVDKCFKVLRATLSDPQWKRLEELAQAELEQRTGPVADLLHGSLGEQLQLSAEQKEHLRKAAKKARETYETGTMEIEGWWLDSLLARLDQDSASGLRQLLGPQPKNTPANLHVWLPFESR